MGTWFQTDPAQLIGARLMKHGLCWFVEVRSML